MMTWYDYSNTEDSWDSWDNTEDSWGNQVAWVGTLSVDFGGDTYDDWRLPTTVDGLGIYGTDGTTTVGHNITTSELGHLFYDELGNQGEYDTSGVYVGSGNYGLNNTGDFQDLVSGPYWSGTEYSAITDNAWYFSFHNGIQVTSNKGWHYYGLAVRSGDVAAVPEPATIGLLGISLAGMMVYGIRRRRQCR
ncbi:MAG: PEP-CTERM sorting domain-containing protein [Candidatus Scalindua sp.]|jgi:hypothetical protein|nr:PEP-CTERM sorting domain-containing protein [Candidatus Scalindua sp.]MBT5304559.1 PEP-CTERM sorting domain-containing protein [Candidatus Scalindua sp.]MBT6045917.1 PEP-CTERM sorting domain-containing protein [Candidatus Scalindua sp.]MBT6231608.1 PEP-CTERM sorting domain-containing protein [Candidatus Scalindua sp.]MBT6562139.1 PEP-CTERM sorting domain-containing protein [Candidatus Scalindua sp.]